MGEDATLDYKRLAMYLEKNYRSYGVGVRYLRQLAGEVAFPASVLPRLPFLGRNRSAYSLVVFQSTAANFVVKLGS